MGLLRGYVGLHKRMCPLSQISTSSRPPRARTSGALTLAWQTSKSLWGVKHVCTVRAVRGEQKSSLAADLPRAALHCRSGQACVCSVMPMSSSAVVQRYRPALRVRRSAECLLASAGR